MPAQLHFGGPDRPPRALRDLLRARVDAVPPGGFLDWVTYYFRDEDLAGALIRASDRGVKVGLAVEGKPRRAGANDAVLARLSAHGLNGGLRIHAPKLAVHGHLHAKLYAFSHPAAAMIGSFNPSGNEPEDVEAIAEIGDQDRGHNLLVEFDDPRLVRDLVRYARRMRGEGASALDRLRPTQLEIEEIAGTTLILWPRLRPSIVDRAMAAGAVSVRGCISHMKPGRLTRWLAALAQQGGAVDLIVHDTERRVPQATIDAMRTAGVRIRRYAHPQGWPLHAKFLLVERTRDMAAWFGSFNFNPRSRWLNHEILARSTDPAIVEGLARRFADIAAETDG